MNDYQKFIYKSRYAKWRDDLGRREEWHETVKRYCDFWMEQYPEYFEPIYGEIYNAIHNMDVMPSMRALMTAGPALYRDNIAGYNCSYVAVDHPAVFSEIMYILMCGTGVGFSVEQQYVSQLPIIAEEFHDADTTIVVPDSRLGWASSYKDLISLLYSGRIPKYDVSRVRPSGERLKTFGGRASGPRPLERLFDYTIGVFIRSRGRRLSTLECHDLICQLADAIIVGGVRRSALISLSNITDERIRYAKAGQWWDNSPQRALANNSVAYTEKPDFGTFLREWTSLYENKSGERGIFNRVAATKQAQSTGRRDCEGHELGTNPCGEILLRSMGLCNLSEVVIRPTDSPEDLKRKVRVATIIGTFQSTLTNFRFLRSGWKKNAEEERLLGVSLTGIMDNVMMQSDSILLRELKDVAIATNKEWADKLGIAVSAAITCVKPSGTVSQLVGCSSGIHPAFSEYYIRSVRLDTKDPLCTFLQAEGVPNEPERFKPDSIRVFYFPMKAPEGSITVKDVSPYTQLDLYTLYKNYWCEHNPSITIYYYDDEFLGIGNNIYNNFNSIIGVTLLPHTDHVYEQAPYKEISKETYLQLSGNFPVIDWSKFQSFEKEDTTTGSQELACVSGACEII